MVRSIAPGRGRRRVPAPAPATDSGPSALAARGSFAANPEQRRLVEALAAAGLALGDIAVAVTPAGVSLATLRRHLADELRHGRAKAHAAVARSLFRQACKGNVAACRLWLDRHVPAASANANGNKDDIASVFDRLVSGSRQRLERQLARLAAAGGTRAVSA